MKKLFFFLLTVVTYNTVTAQNIGIGTTEPLNKLQVVGNLLVNTPTKATNTPPTLAQIETIINAGTVTFADADSTGRIYDPGGPSGNYNANITGFAQILTGAFSTAIEITVESMQLGTGDSLIIKESAFASAYTLLAVGNGYTTTGKWIFNSRSLYLIFKSNADANVGSGFSLLFKRLYADLASMPNVSGVTGKALFFETKTGAFRSGDNTNDVRGNYSTAMGSENTASGGHSTAIGFLNTASGDNSTAMGYNNTASGFASNAWGYTNDASGNYSTALGYGTVASADRSIAMGLNTSSFGFSGTAIGMYNNPILGSPQTTVTSTSPLFIIGNGNNNSSLSNAMVVRKDGNIGISTDAPQTKLHIMNGTDANLGNTSGYLVLGDVTGLNVVFDNNEIIARSAGGNATLSLQATGGAFEVGGTASKPGGGSWTATSDIRLKQNIRPYKDGLQQLLKINPVMFQYNSLSGYNTQQQHVGVIAQELKQVAPYMTGSFTKNNTEYLNVDNTSMTYMLINAVKEQQKQIEELKALLNQVLKQQQNQP